MCLAPATASALGGVGHLLPGEPTEKGNNLARWTILLHMYRTEQQRACMIKGGL